MAPWPPFSPIRAKSGSNGRSPRKVDGTYMADSTPTSFQFSTRPGARDGPTLWCYARRRSCLSAMLESADPGNPTSIGSPRGRAPAARGAHGGKRREGRSRLKATVPRASSSSATQRIPLTSTPLPSDILRNTLSPVSNVESSEKDQNPERAAQPVLGTSYLYRCHSPSPQGI